MAKKQTDWQAHLMETWNKMKAKDKTKKFSDAMKEAAKTYKK